ncbi:polycystin-2-like [Branchiostoma floridae x Branchiostoma belcheri]
MSKLSAPKKVYPPGAASAKRMKVKNEQRRKSVLVVVEYVLLFLFVVILFYISHHDKDPFAFHASQTLSDKLLEQHDSISTADEFWTWTEEILLPVLYPSFWYNGWKMKYLDRQFPLYTEAFRIGPPLLTQVREAPDVPAAELSYNGWMVATGSGSSACWQFNVTGIMSQNSGCASSKYSLELPTLLGPATTLFSDLRDSEWIDKYTDYLVLDLSLYFPAQKLFSGLRLTVQQEDIGHLSTSATVETHRLFQYENGSDDVKLFSYIIFLSLFVIHLVKEMITMKKEGRMFFRSMWNFLTLASMIGSAAAICVFGIRYHLASAALSELANAAGELGIDHLVDLSTTFWWDNVFKHVLAMVVFINTLTLLRVVRFSKTIARFIALPGAMKNELIGFSIIGTIALMAFSCSGTLLFGTHMKAYTNVLHTNFALFEMVLGRFIAQEILESNEYLGPVYFTVFMILIFILLIHFLVTIICDAIATGAYISDDFNEELADYIWKSFQGIFGVYVPPPKDVTTASSGVKEQVENLLKAHEEDTAKYEEAQNENKRRAEAMLREKLSERRMKTQTKPDNERQAMAQCAQELMEQHAADEERLEQQQRRNRRLSQSQLRKKMALRGMQNTDNLK